MFQTVNAFRHSGVCHCTLPCAPYPAHSQHHNVLCNPDTGKSPGFHPVNLTKNLVVTEKNSILHIRFPYLIQHIVKIRNAVCPFSKHFFKHTPQFSRRPDSHISVKNFIRLLIMGHSQIIFFLLTQALKQPAVNILIESVNLQCLIAKLFQLAPLCLLLVNLAERFYNIHI